MAKKSTTKKKTTRKKTQSRPKPTVPDPPADAGGNDVMTDVDDTLEIDRPDPDAAVAVAEPETADEPISAEDDLAKALETEFDTLVSDPSLGEPLVQNPDAPEEEQIPEATPMNPFRTEEEQADRDAKDLARRQEAKKLPLMQKPTPLPAQYNPSGFSLSACHLPPHMIANRKNLLAYVGKWYKTGQHERGGAGKKLVHEISATQIERRLYDIYCRMCQHAQERTVIRNYFVAAARLVVEGKDWRPETAAAIRTQGIQLQPGEKLDI